jgi:hypothetical protein
MFVWLKSSHFSENGNPFLSISSVCLITGFWHDHSKIQYTIERCHAEYIVISKIVFYRQMYLFMLKQSKLLFVKHDELVKSRHTRPVSWYGINSGGYPDNM